MKKNIIILVLAVLIVAVFSVITFNLASKKSKRTIVNMESGVENKDQISEKKELVFGVSGKISAEEALVVYSGLMDRISEYLSIPVRMSYQLLNEDLNKKIRNGEIDFAFISPAAYLDLKEGGYVEMSTVPVLAGSPFYYSYVIAHKSRTDINSFSDLKGKSFAFVDKISDTGFLSPVYVLSERGEDYKSYFSQTIFSGSEDRSITAVANRLVDGAAVDHIIWEYMNMTSPDYTKETKVVESFGPYGISPIVTSSNLDQEIKEKLLALFLNAENDQEMLSFMALSGIEKYIVPDESNYEKQKEMKIWAKENLNQE